MVFALWSIHINILIQGLDLLLEKQEGFKNKLEAAEESINQLHAQVDTTEGLVQDFQKLSKVCVTKMNHDVFFDGQQKGGYGRKKKLSLKLNLTLQMKRR